MWRRILQVLAIGLLIGGAAYGQSLGDIARTNKEKQNAANSPSKVITNDDLGTDPQGNTQPATSGRKAAHSAQPHPIDQHAAEQWKRQIVAQQDKVASLQARIDQINSTIHPAGGAQFMEPSNRYKAQQMDRIAEIQLQLDEQKTKLAEMQEEARRAGMHTTVYDP